MTRVDSLLHCPRAAVRRLQIERDAEAPAGSDASGSVFYRAPHIAGMMQHPPGIDDVEGLFRQGGRIQRIGTPDRPVAFRREPGEDRLRGGDAVRRQAFRDI